MYSEEALQKQELALPGIGRISGTEVQYMLFDKILNMIIKRILTIIKKEI